MYIASAAVTPPRREQPATGPTKLPHTFGQVSAALGGELSTVTLEMLDHFKDRKISLIVERSIVGIGRTEYEKTAERISREYPHTVSSISYLKNSILYSVEKDSQTVSEKVKEAGERSTLTLLLMSMRLAKECLVAAHDLGMETGPHAFVVYEHSVLNMLSRRRHPFKWATVSYNSDSDESFTHFLSRSRKLCWMLERVFVVMVKLPERLLGELTRRVPSLYRHDKKVMVHDLDMWTDGEETSLRTRGRFQVFVDDKGVPRYPLAVYRYGMKNVNERAGARCAALLTGTEGTKADYPIMQLVATFNMKKNTKEEWNIQFVRRSTAKNFRSLKLKSPGELCADCAPLSSTTERNIDSSQGLRFRGVEFLLLLCVSVVSVIVLTLVYRLYSSRMGGRRGTEDNKCLIPIPTDIRVLDNEEEKTAEMV